MSNRDKMTIRFDWLTFTIPSDAFDSLENLVGQLLTLNLDCFTECVGRYGYRRGSFFEHITILQDGARDCMGVCFDISGQGVSYLYSLKDFTFEDCFKLINSLGGNISRLDVALDCYNNELDYDVIYKACADHNYASRWKSCKSIINHRDGGFDTQFGSRSSDIMLRIYDKKVESKCEDRTYWCRLEFQMRHDMAYAFADTYLNSINDKIDFIKLFLGVLTNYLRFIDRRYGDGNSDKCPTLDWWASFIENVAKSCLLRHDDYKSYTAEQLVYNVTTRFSQAYKTFIDIYGPDALLNLLSNVEVKSPSYGSLIKKFHDMEREHGSVKTHAIFDAYLSA